MTSELKFQTEQVTPNQNRRGDLDLIKQQTLQTPFKKQEIFLNNNEQIIQAQISDQIQEKQFGTEVKPSLRIRKPPLKKVQIALGVSSVSIIDIVNSKVTQATNSPTELIGNLKLNQNQIKVAQDIQQKHVTETNRTITPSAHKQSRLEKKLAYEAMKKGEVLYTKEFQNLRRKMIFKEHDFEGYKELHKLFNVEGIFGLEQDLFYDEKHSENSEIRKKEIEKIQEMQDAQVNEEDLDVMVEQDFQENNRKRPKGITYAEEMAQHMGEGQLEQLQKKNPLTNIGVYVVAQNVQQQYDQVKGQFSEDMCVRFGFHKMQQEFAKSLIKNQKIIFNELTAEEKEALKKKKIEDLQKLELQELIRNKAMREAREEQAILDVQPDMILDPHQQLPVPKLITKPPIDTE